MVLKLQPRFGEIGYHFSCYVIGGRPQPPPAYNHEVGTLTRQESQCRSQIRGPIRDTEYVGYVDAKLPQSLRQPWAIKVSDRPGQQLRTRDYDSGPDRLLCASRLLCATRIHNE